MKKFYLFFILGFITATGFAQSELVKDIREGTDNASPAEIFVFGNNIFFKATDGTTDFELWKSDGTTEGTVLVKDIRNGGSSSPYDFFELNNELYFTANDGSGNGLWKTDGTEGGTVSVIAGAMVLNPLILDGKVYHVNSLDGNKLYEFDGTNRGAVANAGTGTDAVIGADFTNFNNKLLLYMDYSEDEATVGRELYEYDPATDLFTLIKDVDNGTGDASISNFTELSSKVYFEADNYLWVTDGTTGGTEAVTAAAAIGSVREFYAWNDLLFFEGDDGNGDQLWAYDPTAGTVTNMSNLTGANNDHDPSDYCVAGDYLYYRGEDKNNTDGHLWRTDGTTIELIDSIIKDVDDIVYLNGVLYFEAEDTTGTTTGNELFKYDLRKSVEFTINDGTNPVEGVSITLTGYDAVTTNVSGVATVNNVIPETNIAYTITKSGYFEVSGTTTVADDNVTITESIEKIITSEIELVKDIREGSDNGSPAEIFTFEDNIFFKASDGTTDFELWKSDGTANGTILVKDIRDGGSSSPYDFFELNNELYFTANDGSGNGLWKTDGTEGGTVSVLAGAMVLNPVVLEGKVYHVNSLDGNKLYEFDGTNRTAVANAGTGTDAVIGAEFTKFNNKLLLYMDYSEDEATVGRELYEYDPSTDLFTLIKDVDNGTGDASISNFTELSSKVYFEADNYLWVTDGTTVGTEAVTAAAAIGSVREFYAWNDLLFFEGDDGNGDQLWVYNPLTDGVTNISNISGANENHDPSDYAVYGDYLYYAAEDAFDTKQHLWRTDGTNVEQLDNNFIDIDDLVILNHTLYFEADEDGVTGNELYKLYIGGYYDVIFTVTDGTNPIEGATVTLTGYDAVTSNSSGVATISNVTIATDLAYTVTFDGYVTHNGTVSILDGNVSENVTLNLTTYDVTFMVTDGTNALQGATVTLTGYNAVNSDASGVATVSGVVPAIDIAYTVSLTDYEDANGTVTVTDTNVNENVTMQIQTGIEDITQEFAKVYPIPTNGKITIETEEINASYTIYDVCGKVVEKMTITETETKVDLSAYSKGIYLIEIMSENKRNIQRIILQ